MHLPEYASVFFEGAAVKGVVPGLPGWEIWKPELPPGFLFLGHFQGLLQTVLIDTVNSLQSYRKPPNL